jgi:hypothetical protein
MTTSSHSGSAQSKNKKKKVVILDLNDQKFWQKISLIKLREDGK